MSRVGNEPIALPDGVDVQIDDSEVRIKGPKGELSVRLLRGVRFELDDGILRAVRVEDSKQARAFHGLARSLAANAVTGVSEGYRKELVVEGIGYRANVEGRSLKLQLGFSHVVDFPLPQGIDVEVEGQTEIAVVGADKQQVGEVAAEIRKIRPPDVYKGKGVRYRDEVIHKKVGKAGAGAGAMGGAA